MAYRIEPDRPFDEEVRRIAAEEVGAVMAALGTPGEEGEDRIHGARKRLKKTRGLLRLVRKGAPAFYQAENARYRDIARALAGARDAAALVETADRFIEDYPREAAVLGQVRAALVERRDRLTGKAMRPDGAIAAAIERCREGLAAIAVLELPRERAAAAAVISDGVRKTLRKIEKAAAAASTPEDFHEMRKGVKYHWMHLGLTRRLWPDGVSRRRKEVKALGERLGELNDIAVMRDTLEAEALLSGMPGAEARFRELLGRKEKKLRRRIMSETERLFSVKPVKAARLVAKGYGKKAA